MRPLLNRLKNFYTARSPLERAIAFSVLVHLLLLTVRIVDPESFNRVFKDTPLEVILVNAKTNDALDQLQAKAQAIAQYKLNGGGDADKGLSSSPLPPAQQTDTGLAADQAQMQIEMLQTQQMRLLSDIKEQVAHLPKPDPKIVKANQRAEQEVKRRQLLKLLGSIERRINEENARPKKRYISPATRQEAYALYYDDLRQKIEQRGTQNFPESVGRKLYGELTMMITVNHEGHVLGTEVVSSSGSKALDLRAQAIANQASPFGVFSQAMRRSADQLVIVSRFKFTREATLEATLSAP